MSHYTFLDILNILCVVTVSRVSSVLHDNQTNRKLCSNDSDFSSCCGPTELKEQVLAMQGYVRLRTLWCSLCTLKRGLFAFDAVSLVLSAKEQVCVSVLPCSSSSNS